MKRSQHAPERLLLLALLCLLALLGVAQEHVQRDQDEAERIAITGNQAITSCLELMPDGHTLLVGTTQDHPVYVMDTRDWTVLRTIDVDGYYAGPEVKASAGGTYLMLRQRFYIDWRVNKDRLVRHEVVDFATGRTVLTITEAHDAQISPDERFIYSLEGEQVTVRSLPDGKDIRRINVPLTRAALAISPDGNMIAVSHRPTQPQLETVPSMRNDKSGLKPALKFREMVSVFDVATGRLLGTIPEVYDVIYDMTFTATGDRLLIYAIPHEKLNPGAAGVVLAGRKGIVNMVEMPAMTPIRTAFLSLMNEPQVEPNLQGDRIALASVDGTINGRKVYVYNMATGEFTLDLDMNTRWRTDVKEKEYHDGGVPYHFLADGRTLAIGSGAYLRLIRTP
ncbi:MAG: WD40 repeat domain-containing protein [Flavobacteriales bacterium]|nr:WD40 repeat domain-containing protein [Flavobacteriales bacterium]